MKNIKVGDNVVWGHTVSKSSGLKDFIAFGKILRIYKSKIGGRYEKKYETEVASISLLPNEYWDRIKRKKTTIKLSLLSKQ